MLAWHGSKSRELVHDTIPPPPLLSYLFYALSGSSPPLVDTPDGLEEPRSVRDTVAGSWHGAVLSLFTLAETGGRLGWRRVKDENEREDEPDLFHSARVRNDVVRPLK